MDFIHHEIAKQFQLVHAFLFPLSTVHGLPNLWLSPVAVIPQVGQRLHLTIGFTWIGLNKSTALKAPKDAMQFGGTLHHIIRRVLTPDPSIGSVYLLKVDLTDAYVQLWFRIDNTPSLDFLLPKKRPED